MPISNELNHWSIEDSTDLYNIHEWGCGFYGVDGRGDLYANLNGQPERQVRIMDVVEKVQAEGLDAPLLIRFPEIISQRTKQINEAFRRAIQEFEFKGTYRCLYPAKVNQHHEVIESVIRAGQPYGGGVEAGSKAELLSLLGMTDNNMPILCNGFKDQRIVEVAMRAIQLGRNLTIVIEKPNDLELILNCAERLDVCPTLGVRVKLAARTGGHWQASGGAKSKFGLNVSQLRQVIRTLKDRDWLDALTLLHFHPGSQISNVRKIKASLIEAARIYADLYKSGVPLKTIDVGGGLAVDYTGEQNQDPSSMNYTLQEYANDVVYYIQQVCDQMQVPHPNIYSESGRALTAHHSMLVVPIVETTPDTYVEKFESIDQAVCQSSPLLAGLNDIYRSLNQQNLVESYHDTQTAIETVWQMFSHGSLHLDQRICAEQLVWAICGRIQEMLAKLDFVPRELENLHHQLADTYLANFSLFQALPDSWALNQIFPVVPIHRLDERPDRRGVLADITCDSDGQISCFIGGAGPNKSLPLHSSNGQPYYLGIFLVGAYQEALSDDHNLMGKFHVVSVGRNDQSNRIEIMHGSTVREVLEHVNYNMNHLRESVESSVREALADRRIDRNQSREILAFFDVVVEDYTYLSEVFGPPPVLNSTIRHSGATWYELPESPAREVSLPEAVGAAAANYSKT
jgi:arginine decarboxylase